VPFHFYERPTLVPVFAHQRKSQEDFYFFRKKAKSENNDQRWFCIELLEAAQNPAARVAPPSDFTWSYIQRLSVKPPVL